ncbi:MAG: hypothetical protein H7249_20100 [Chitinophagaceae bacterium]|nr:hypothetical protein [Oligoflexus sp.]
MKSCLCYVVLLASLTTAPAFAGELPAVKKDADPTVVTKPGKDDCGSAPKLNPALDPQNQDNKVHEDQALEKLGLLTANKTKPVALPLKEKMETCK